MAKAATRKLGVVGILRKVLAIPLRNPRLMASVLLLLLPWNLLLTVPKLSPRLSVDISPLLSRLNLPQGPFSHGELPGTASPGGPPTGVLRPEKLPIDVVAPVDYVVSGLSTLAIVYLSAVACKEKHVTVGALLSKVKRSWRKVAVSFLYFRLLNFAYTCLFLLLGAAMVVFRLPSWVLSLALLAVFYMFCCVIVFSLYLDVACRLSLIICAVEEDKCGVAALARAVGLASGRKLQGLLLTVLFFALSRLTAADYAKMGGEKQTDPIAVAWRCARVLADLAASLLGWLLWTVYYYECRRSRGEVGKEERIGDEGQSLIPMSCTADGEMI